MDTGGETILLIEDDEALAGMWKNLLGKEGYTVLHAATAAQGMAVINKKPLDLIVLDLMLPDASGFDLLDKLRSRPESKRIPVMIVSAMDSVQDKVRGVESGAEDYLVKPLHHQELIARVRAILRRAATRHQQETRLKSAMTISVTDSLTGLYNRQFLQVELERSLSITKRYQRSFCLLFMDIDHFKRINDNYGHLIGDKLLKQLAALLQDKLRSCDVVTRFGGEEFIILLPETGLADATALAAKLREQVEVYSFSDLDDEGITISIGLAEWHQDDDAATLIRRADLAMYKAKQAGRNRVEVAGGDIKSPAMAVSGS